MLKSTIIHIFTLLVLTNLAAQTAGDQGGQYRLALRQIGQDRYEEGIRGLQQAIESDSAFADAYRRLAETYIFLDKVADGRRYFKTKLAHAPDNPYAYYALARFDLEQGNLDEAMLKLKRCIGLEPAYADAYGFRGGLPEVYRARNDLDGAVIFFKALIQRQPDNPCVYYGLARTYIRKYKWRQALATLQKVVTLDPDFILAYHSKISIYFSTNRHEDVLTTCAKLTHLATRVGDIEMVTYATMMRGNAYFYFGDYFQALQYFNDALLHARDIGAKRREGLCLNNMATVYALTANFPKARQYFSNALEFARRTGATAWEIQALTNLGNVSKDEGDYDTALGYYTRVTKKSAAIGYKYEESVALSNMAEIYQQRGDYDTATRHLTRALKLARDMKDKAQEGFVLRNLGTLSQDLGRPVAAIHYLNQAHQIGIAAQDMQIIWETETGLASCYQKQGHPDAAIRHYAKAIALYDSVRQTLDIESLRNNFLEDKYEAYPSIVKLLGEAGSVKESFSFAEKYKAKSLLEIVSSARNLFGSTLPDSARTLLEAFAGKLENAHRRLSSELNKSDRDSSETFALDQEITTLELRRAGLINTLKKDHRAYVELTSADILSASQVRKEILRKGQVLLEYVMSPDALSVIVISQDSMTYLTLNITRADVAEMLKRLSPIFRKNRNDEQPDDAIFNAALADFSVKPLHDLYLTLLAPIVPHIEEAQELIIVPDDLLFYIPFEMLVVDTTGVTNRYDFDHARFFLEKYTVSYASSASLLRAGLTKDTTPSKDIFALGDPAFDEDSNPSSQPMMASRTPDLLPGAPRLRRLPNSKIEVEAIGEAINSPGNLILTGAEATEDKVKRQAGDYRIVHLATHFVADDNQPLYSKVALARSKTASEDGYLQTYEVFNLHLNADLVVLSACKTALGNLRRGEGVVGISRAFQYAGVPSLLVSLWNVDDRSTSNIMIKFYENLKSGMRQNAALREAKLDFIHSSQSSQKDPFYWAPFVLLGSQKPIPLHGESWFHPWLAAIAITLVLFLLIGVWAARKRTI